MPSGIFTLKQQELALGQGAWSNQKPLAVDYLVVAGGGGAGASGPGGAGAGGVLLGSVAVASGSAITVTVGGGGSGTSGSSAPGNGSNSVFGSITATGGGKGENNAVAAGSGGSGGGAGSNSLGAGQGTAGQGNAGGSTYVSGGGGASSGGGGAGMIGISPVVYNAGGQGGSGIGCAISGTLTGYGGGGAGSTGNTGTGYSLPVAAYGGGGAGVISANGSSGTANTGGGGSAGSGYTGGNGGSGIVIISYPDTYAAAASTTGSPTVSTSGSGSISLNGSNQYLSGPSTALLNYSTGSFTVEFWVYATTIGALTVFFSASNATQDFQIGLSPTNYLYWHNSGNQITNAGNAASCPLNQWNHIVLVRSGSSCALYCNGTRFGTATNSAAVNLTQFVIGTYWNGAPNYSTTGNITNVRISNTNMYDPSSSSITVPTAPFTPLSSTNFLLSAVSGSQFADSSSSSLILGAPNSPTWNQLSPFATGLGYKNRVYTWTSSGSITF